MISLWQHSSRERHIIWVLFLSNIYSMNIHIYSKRVQMPLLEIVWDHGMGAILFRRSMYFELIEFLNVQNYIL
jgi:hypothetical protein